MPYETIKLSSDEGIAFLQLDRPQRLNAMTKGMIEELGNALSAVAGDSTLRCLLISGNGRAFCAGADLTGGNESSHPVGALGEIYNPVFRALAEFPAPVVCAVHGACAGAGVSLAMSCDIVIAEESAYFLEAFVNAGLVPDTGASWLLPRVVGRAKAAGMLLLGSRVTAAQASEWGLIWQTAEDGKLSAAALQIARQLAASSPATIRAIKTLLRESARNSYAEQLDLEARFQHIAEQSDDHREAAAAFLEKRPPRFSS